MGATLVVTECARLVRDARLWLELSRLRQYPTKPPLYAESVSGFNVYSS